MTQLPPSPRALVVALPMIPFQERPTLGKEMCWERPSNRFTAAVASAPSANMLGIPGLAQPCKGGVLWGG